MKQRIALASEWVAAARRIVVLTGAGVSAESGVPTFRGEEGLWKRYRPEQLATPDAFRGNPSLVWEWYRYRQALVEGTEPNAAHHALARLEKRPGEFLLVTQNVDGHHERAGSQNVVELHGNLFQARCDECGESRSMRGEGTSTGIPRCTRGHDMRPGVVWFGEPLPAEALEAAWQGARRCDLFLVIGTSALVQPAASLPVAAKESGARLVEVNVDETVLTGLADVALHGRAAEIMPLITSANEGA